MSCNISKTIQSEKSIDLNVSASRMNIMPKDIRVYKIMRRDEQ